MTGFLVFALLAPSLADGLEADLRRSGIRRSGLGVMVGRAGGGPLLAVHADTPRIPASNQKILTAAAAVKLLGADFRFATRVGRAPGGEVIVVGDGDPNFSGRFYGGNPTVVLRRLARDVKSHGIRRVPALVIDASRFDDQYVHPDWPKDQLDRWYCAPVAALVYNDSCWDVTVSPGRGVGRPALVEVQPALLRPQVLNNCGTVDAGRHVVHIGRDSQGHGLAVRGSILRTSRGVKGNVTVRDPVTFFAQSVRAAFLAEGIAVGDVRIRRRAVVDSEVDRKVVPEGHDKQPDKLTPLVVLRTDLRRTLRVILTDSQNLYAECVFKRLGDGSFAGGAVSVKRALRAMKAPLAGLDIRDGSGMARTNRVTPRALFMVLQAMRGEEAFVSSMAAGGTGTLRRRYRDLGERVRAKTGTLRGVTALSGYVTGRSGGRYVFVILANGRSVAHARRFQDLIVQQLARAP